MKFPKTVPQLDPVKDSSNVQAIGYSPKTNYLYVQFLPPDKGYDGELYRYAGVPESVYTRFVSAPSKGMYVWAHLRDKFAYAKWTGFGWRKSTALQRMSQQKRQRKKTFKRWAR